MIDYQHSAVFTPYIAMHLALRPDYSGLWIWIIHIYTQLKLP